MYETLLEEFSEEKGFEKKDFLQVYSYNLSSKESSRMIEGLNSSDKAFDREKIIPFRTGQNSILKYLIETYKENLLRFADNSKDISSLTKGFFQWVEKKSEEEIGKDAYSRLYSKIRVLESQNTSFHTAKDHVVGNREFILQIENSLRILFLYDHKNKKHPHLLRYGSYPQRILAVGLPGCGKSFTLEAMIGEANQLSERYSKPLIVKDISNEFKSKYYGESAKNLGLIFKEVERGDSLHMLIADDIDTVVFPRNDHEHSENISVFGELIKCIESVHANNKGNYLLIATTNKPESLDPALLRRFQKKILVEGVKTPQDYSKLLRMKLGRYIDDGLVKITDWEKIGALFFESGISGSIVSDIASSITDKILSSDFPETMYYLPVDAVSSKLKEAYSPLSEAQVVGLIEQALSQVVMPQDVL